MNRALMALAAYNAGSGDLRKFRKHAARHELDPNVWLGNAETGAAAIFGQETVRYVPRDLQNTTSLILLWQRITRGNGPAPLFPAAAANIVSFNNRR
jgi:hypothetical protein